MTTDCSDYVGKRFSLNGSISVGIKPFDRSRYRLVVGNAELVIVDLRDIGNGKLSVTCAWMGGGTREYELEFTEETTDVIADVSDAKPERKSSVEQMTCPTCRKPLNVVFNKDRQGKWPFHYIKDGKKCELSEKVVGVTS